MSAYVYIWFKPDWTPFYVGIGKTPSRWNPCRVKKKDRNPLCFKIVSKYGAENIRVNRFVGLSWPEACAMEQSFIAHFGRISEGGLLANFTDGGEGVINPKKEVLEEKRKRLLDPYNPMREYHKVLNSDPLIRAKRTETIRSTEVQTKIRTKLNAPEAKEKRLAKLRETINSPEYQAKLALRRKPKSPKKTKEEVSKIRSENMKRLNADKSFAKNRIAALKNSSEAISIGVLSSMSTRLATMQTPEVQAKLRKPKDDAHKAKLSAAKKAYWAKRKGLI